MEITERVRAVQTRHRADFADEGFNNDLKFGLVEVVYEWAKGMVRLFLSIGCLAELDSNPLHLYSHLRKSPI